MKNRLPRREFLAEAAQTGLVAACFPGLPLLGSAASSMAASAVEGGAAADLIVRDLLKSETDPFRRAVLTGDIRTVEQFLARDPALVYARDVDGQSVYLLAAYAGQTTVMSLLESKGLVLDVYEAMAGGNLPRIKELLGPAPGLMRIPNSAGDTPLHVAALCSQSAAIDNTIVYGTDFAARNPKRKNATAAHFGLQSPRQDAAEAMAFAMIGNGLDPNLATDDGNTILHSAARTGYPRVIRLLLQKGADAGLRNAASQTPLDIAAAGGKTEAADLLRNAASIQRHYYARRFAYDPKFGRLQRDDTQGLPRDFINVFVLVSHFNLDQVKKWVALAPELLNTRASWDELPVEAAAHVGRPDIGGHLLDLGASYSLCTATVLGSLDDVKRMLAEDPQRIHERGAHSFPLLWYTAFGKPKLDAAEYLIRMGADPREDMRGRTVLHTAAASGHLDLCRFFLEHGLDPLQKGASFLGTHDAIESAEQAKHPEVAQMIRDWVKSHPK